MNNKLKLPKQFKKQIVAFCREYEKLSVRRIINVKIPAHIAKVDVEWCSDDEVDTEFLRFECNKMALSKLREVRLINESIKDFCKRTEQFGHKHFGDKDWLWSSVLWNYKPETGEQFVPDYYTWVE
jgi:hypothetical protein